MIEESALRRRMRSALARTGLKRVRLHDLRHSYCTMAVRAYRLDEVKAYAGHADIATTMRYVHHVPANDAADKLSAIVAAASPQHAEYPASVPNLYPQLPKSSTTESNYVKQTPCKSTHPLQDTRS